jgi:FkbM family methyltransferase
VIQRLVSALGRALDRRAELPDLLRLGSDYGGYAVPRSVLSSDAVCYTAGLGEDATFDLALAAEFGCEVWGIDATPRSLAFGEEIARRESRFHLVPVAVWSEEGELRLYAPRDLDHVSHSALNLQSTGSYFSARSKTVAGLMRAFGHTRLGLLKLNVEGAEVPVLERALADGIEAPVLCVAFEHPSRIRIALTKLRLRRAGYRLVWRENAKHTYVA